MALPIDDARVRSVGIWSPYKSVEELMIPDPRNSSRMIVDLTKTSITLAQAPGAFANIAAFQNSGNRPGFSGSGIDWSLLPSLMGPCMMWFLAIMALRYCCREPLARFGMHMGVVTVNGESHKKRLAEGKRGIAALSRPNQKKILKFQNQLWLAFFYVVSSCFGYYVQRDKSWFTFPLSDYSCASMVVPQPYNPPREIVTYYQYGLAFYMAELFSLLLIEKHVKRSDFLEYVFHHFLTLALIILSHVGLEHRIGAYILFIHDASDIMLCVAKVLHYMVNEDAARVKNARKKGRQYTSPRIFRYVLTENFVNGCFAGFIIVFFYLRLYIFPMVMRSTFGMMPQLRHGTFNMWLLVTLLNVFLQSLHVYWGVLIVIMVVSLITGGERKDVRSDSEPNEEEPDTVLWNEHIGLTCESPVKASTKKN